MARRLITKVIASLFHSPRPLSPLTADCFVCFVLHRKLENKIKIHNKVHENILYLQGF